jgi:acyl-[acyl-carrier-protein]-phospholipid O-acyltransferase/long-chain-fatty-acid--[acyl-carrier-protein] ligase
MFNKFGAVGRILPGMEARLDKVEGVEEGGRLVVRGPNVMVGYLKTDKPGVLEPPPDGWHDTGDIVTIDAQGFITIKGRAKRFAKVGGEMISLAAVEALAGDLWPQHLCAVVAVPDARKGERLILATEKKDATRAEFMTFAKQRYAADLMIPSEVMIFDKLPVLGSGKVDLVSLAKLVDERIAAKPDAMARAQA